MLVPRQQYSRELKIAAIRCYTWSRLRNAAAQSHWRGRIESLAPNDKHQQPSLKITS